MLNFTEVLGRFLTNHQYIFAELLPVSTTNNEHDKREKRIENYVEIEHSIDELCNTIPVSREVEAGCRLTAGSFKQ